MKMVCLRHGIAVLLLVLCAKHEAAGGFYTSSAHGDSSYGANRSSTSALGFTRGNCAHCHEQHASIGSSEPSPTGGPSGALLFYNNYVSQTDGVCFKCHDGTSTYQTGGIVNRSYSYRAGAWTADALNDILEAFSFTTSTTYPSSSSHSLADIKTFISAAGQAAWNYTDKSNPCAACHNPHAVQGDPANAGPPDTKSAGNRGWMLSRPSQHDNIKTWRLWGDDASEKMSSAYAGLYKAPYRFGGVGSGYEPDGSGTSDGSNLTDFNTFCMDCHNSTNTIYSTLLGRNLKKVDWGAVSGDRHGRPTAGTTTLIAPYTSGSSYVLSCTDCHEPHGSPNIFLTRREVNNGTVLATGANQTTGGTQWASLCERCHGNSTTVSASHHAIMGGAGCSPCHGAPMYIACISCHYHGSSSTVDGITYRSF